MRYAGDMPKLFRQALIEALKHTGKPLAEVAEKAGVSYEQLKKVRQREDATTNVDDARKVANAFGVSLDEFLEDQTAQDRLEIASLYSQLSEAERRLILAAARGMRAQALPEGQ